jgi:hypothetical protein
MVNKTDSVNAPHNARGGLGRGEAACSAGKKVIRGATPLLVLANANQPSNVPISDLLSAVMFRPDSSINLMASSRVIIAAQLGFRAALSIAA